MTSGERLQNPNARRFFRRQVACSAPGPAFFRIGTTVAAVGIQ